MTKAGFSHRELEARKQSRVRAPVAASRIPSSPRGDSLAQFLREIREFPLLEPQEEYLLARRWREHGDLASARRLVTSHLRLVAKIASGYRGYGLPFSDLVSEGNVGLMQAVKRFDPERGFRLSTYAMWWIRASIQEYVLRSWSLVKIGTTSSQKKLFFGLRKLKGRLRALDEGDLPPETATIIARELGVPATDVIEMNRRLSSRDSSLNAPIQQDGDAEWVDRLAADGLGPESEFAAAEELRLRRGLLKRAMVALTERERRILADRRLIDPPKTLDELGRTYGVSRERVRQIEGRAFEKVLHSVKTAISSDRLVLE